MERDRAPRLRTLHIDLGRGWAGGQTQSHALAVALAGRGHDVTFVCRTDGELARRLAGMPLRSRPIAVGGRLDPQSVVRIGGILRTVQPEIIHLHDSLSFWLGGVAARISCAGVPVIVHKRTDHAPGGLGALRYRTLATRIIAISQGAAESLVGAGVSPALVSVVYSSVDCEHFRPRDGAGVRTELGLPSGALVIGAIGTLARRKGHDVLLHAAVSVLEREPTARIVICGEGPQQSPLEELARSLGIAQSVVFLPQRTDVRPILAALDVFAMPSRAEGLGVAVLEAMAMGKPVVASGVGGLRECVQSGTTGLLVEPDDPAALADALLRLLRDRELRRECGAAGRLRAERLFSREAMVDATEAVYRAALGARSAP